MIKEWINQIVCGDAINLIKEISNESIDLILTDPPYGIKKEGIKNSSNLETFYLILPECYRVLKKDGFFITFFSTKLLPEIFKNNPFIYHWQFILNCPLGSVRSPIGFSKYMSCLVFKKGNPKIIKWNKDIFNDSPSKMVEPDEGFINHPSPKPKQFISELLKMFSKEKDIILDPFVGSGSTALACSLCDRNFIGFEIEKEYCDLAIERLDKLRYRNI
ncbi:MAG: site-specific DNA-methyltransferase [Nanoarchaeota archaeon]|nr:site-specific DNA-methyltransferase [Nanoarchaeota archaeon]